MFTTKLSSMAAFPKATHLSQTKLQPMRIYMLPYHLLNCDFFWDRMWNLISCVMRCQHLWTLTIFKHSFLHDSLTVNANSGVCFKCKACNFTGLAEFPFQEIFLKVNHQICIRTISSRGSRDSAISLRCTDDHLIKPNFANTFSHWTPSTFNCILYCKSISKLIYFYLNIK